MNAKRILPWERNEDSDGWFAETKIATYFVFDDGYWYIDNLEDGHPANAELAMDACESDYIARCTEFLRVAGPGECVVNAIDLEGLLAMYQKGTRYADSDEIVQRLTAAIALANGYVKAEDYEALKAKLAEVTDQLEDATDTLDLIESEADLFDATAIASGYVKLEPGQVVVDKALHELALSLAHRWEQHIEGRVYASQEARDE